jgi:hypothetical protein
MTGALTLADVAARTPTLVVACTRCDRAGRYSLDTLIKRYNRRLGVPELLAKLSADCPQRLSVSASDLCGIHCPEMSKLFLAKSVDGASDGAERQGHDPAADLG